MIYICCDTNIWINISNGLEPPRLLDRLYEEVTGGNIKLLLPEIIKHEWKRNKEKAIVSSTNESTKKQIAELKKLNEFLQRDELDMSFLWDDDIEDESKKLQTLRDKISELLLELNTHKNEIIKKAKRNVERVEEIFEHHSTIILQTDPKSSLAVMQLAIEKQFPFVNEKNNFADSLIFHQFINFLKDNNLEKGHFVTSNKKEFFPEKILHQSLQIKIDETNSFFYTSLSEALNKTLNEELVNLKELKRIELLAAYDFEMDEAYCCIDCDSHGRNVSTIHFSYDLELKDNRIKNDKAQQNVELEWKLNNGIEIDISDVAEIAICDSCETVHVVCPECKTIWDFQTYSANEIQHCEDCNLKFIYKEEEDEKGIIQNSYLELCDETDYCSKCGTNPKELGIDICETCNNEYINN